MNWFHTIKFAAGDDVGNIFHADGMIHLTDGTQSVRVPASEYHRRMREWVGDRMTHPLVWTGEGVRCVMISPVNGAGDVIVEITALTSPTQSIG